MRLRLFLFASVKNTFLRLLNSSIRRDFKPSKPFSAGEFLMILLSFTGTDAFGSEKHSRFLRVLIKDVFY